jgi:hypothetical protein
MGSWIRIRIANAYPDLDPKEEKVGKSEDQKKYEN